jgi:hypothetical protein
MLIAHAKIRIVRIAACEEVLQRNSVGSDVPIESKTSRK